MLKQLICLLAVIFAGCLVYASLMLSEFGSTSNLRPSSRDHLAPAEIKPTAPEIRKLADPLSSLTQRGPEPPYSVNDANLRDVRLTGIVTGPDLRIAIFAVTGTGPLVLSEGEALKGWRLDKSHRGVSCSAVPPVT